MDANEYEYECTEGIQQDLAYAYAGRPTFDVEVAEKELEKIFQRTGQVDNILSKMIAQARVWQSLDKPLIPILEAELKRRGAPLPINCRFEHSPYARGGKYLRYDLEEKDATQA